MSITITIKSSALSNYNNTRSGQYTMQSLDKHFKFERDDYSLENKTVDHSHTSNDINTKCSL